jgi:leucyl aminopeptidase (aminopeptidase T)
MRSDPFGPVVADLLPGARNAVQTCLSVRAADRVLLMADEASGEVAASLGAALGESGARWTGMLLERLGARPFRTVPQPLLEGIGEADVGILCMQPREGELTMRMGLVAAVERRQVRYAHMVGVTPSIMRQGMRADYRAVDRLSERLRERMSSARALTVKTDLGTAFTASFDPGLAWVKTSGLISPRYWSNLPAGEVFTTPARVDGTFVCNATLGDYFNAKYGDLRNTPLVLDIEGGRLRGVRSSRKDLEREFWAYTHTDPWSDLVGELAFGTNIGLRELIGILLQDEKVPGVHLAFGDPYGTQTGASWSSTTHVDVLTRECDVWIDDEKVMAKGIYDLKSLRISDL